MMMDTKHTPGPWWVEVYDNETFIEAKSQTICGQVSNCDASLIAAAPELLDALESLVNTWETGLDFSNEIGEARAAIAKAKGA